jgi:hypothetical protein
MARNSVFVYLLLFCVVQSLTVTVADPPLATSAQALNCTSQVLCAAAAKFTKVSPLTSNGRSALPEFVIATGAAPTDPVKVWRFCEVAAVVEPVAAEADGAAGAAGAAEVVGAGVTTVADAAVSPEAAAEEAGTADAAVSAEAAAEEAGAADADAEAAPAACDVKFVKPIPVRRSATLFPVASRGVVNEAALAVLTAAAPVTAGSMSGYWHPLLVKTLRSKSVS